MMGCNFLAKRPGLVEAAAWLQTFDLVTFSSLIIHSFYHHYPAYFDHLSRILRKNKKWKQIGETIVNDD